MLSNVVQVAYFQWSALEQLQQRSSAKRQMHIQVKAIEDLQTFLFSYFLYCLCFEAQAAASTWYLLELCNPGRSDSPLWMHAVLEIVKVRWGVAAHFVRCCHSAYGTNSMLLHATMKDVHN